MQLLLTVYLQSALLVSSLQHNRYHNSKTTLIMLFSRHRRTIATMLTVLALVLLTIPSSAFQPVHRHHKSQGTMTSKRVQTSSVSNTRSSITDNGLITKFSATAKDANEIISTRESSERRQPPFLVLSLLLTSVAAWCSSPNLANADQSYLDARQGYTPTSTTISSRSNTLFLATYSDEGSGGMPFLSPFQTPGAIPRATDPKFDDRETRNRAYDDAFDQDKRDRDAYYAKMALQAREKKMEELKARRAELGLDIVDAGPRFGDEKVADMASLRSFLLEQDPSTLTPAELQARERLQK